ncbi:hypothetical protein VTO73DRAFT_13840 [Trametes versicolor]
MLPSAAPSPHFHSPACAPTAHLPPPPISMRTPLHTVDVRDRISRTLHAQRSARIADSTRSYHIDSFAPHKTPALLKTHNEPVISSPAPTVTQPAANSPSCPDSLVHDGPARRRRARHGPTFPPFDLLAQDAAAAKQASCTRPPRTHLPAARIWLESRATRSSRAPAFVRPPKTHLPWLDSFSHQVHTAAARRDGLLVHPPATCSLKTTS